MSRSTKKAPKSQNEKRETKRRVNRTIKWIIWIIQAVASAFLGFSLVRLGMLSTPMLGIAIGVLVILLVATFFLLGIGKFYGHSQVKARHVIGGLVALLMVVNSVLAASVVNRIIGTVEEVTKPAVASTVVAVYVLKEDQAYSLSDARDYEFGFSKGYDGEHVVATLDAMSHDVLEDITSKEYENIAEMVDDLLKGESRAILLNQAYASLLDDLEQFEGFIDKTRVIYEKSFVIQEMAVEPAKETEKTEEKEEKKDEPKPTVDKEAFIMYLSGLDTRSTYLSTSRSDVNILMTVNPSTREILLVNTPRDYYVPISVGGGAYDKLTHCGIYGVWCSANTLSNLYGVNVDYTAQINFTGVERLVDEIGGVDVYSDVGFTTSGTGYYIDAGYNHLNGSQALAFARERYHLAGGDNARGRNQMKVLTGVIDKISSSPSLAANYNGILGSLSGMFTTDMEYKDIASLVRLQLQDGSSWNINSYAVTGYGSSSRYTYSMPGWNLYVMEQNPDSVAKARSLMDRVLAGEHISSDEL